MDAVDRRWAQECPRRLALGLVAVSVLAAAATVWGWVGDVSEAGGSDRLLRAPELSRAVELTMTVLGVAGTVVVLAVLRRSRTLLRRPVWEVVGLSLLLGALVAGGGRVVSARSSGANIGGGMVLIVAPFVVVPVLFQMARRLRRLTPPEG